MSSGSVLDQRVELTRDMSTTDRDQFENRQSMYSLIRQLEFLEKADSQGVFQTKADEDMYTEQCSRLLTQYKNSLRWMPGGEANFNPETFMAQYEVAAQSINAVLHRIKEDKPRATQPQESGDSVNITPIVMDVTTAFTEVSDMVEIGMLSVDQLHPAITKLLASLNKLPKLPADYPAKTLMGKWVDTLSAMNQADATITESQGRQLQFECSTQLTNLRATTATW